MKTPDTTVNPATGVATIPVDIPGTHPEAQPAIVTGQRLARAATSSGIVGDLKAAGYTLEDLPAGDDVKGWQKLFDTAQSPFRKTPEAQRKMIDAVRAEFAKQQPPEPTPRPAGPRPEFPGPAAPPPGAPSIAPPAANGPRGLRLPEELPAPAAEPKPAPAARKAGLPSKPAGKPEVAPVEGQLAESTEAAAPTPRTPIGGFAQRLSDISKSRDIPALEKAVADMEEYRNSGGPKTAMDYKILDAMIQQGYSTLRQVNR
jgi:hypothetical protein